MDGVINAFSLHTDPLPSVFKLSLLFQLILKITKRLFCYKYNKSIRTCSTILNYNKLVTELDIETTIRDS